MSADILLAASQVGVISAVVATVAALRSIADDWDEVLLDQATPRGGGFYFGVRITKAWQELGEVRVVIPTGVVGDNIRAAMAVQAEYLKRLKPAVGYANPVPMPAESVAAAIVPVMVSRQDVELVAAWAKLCESYHARRYVECTIRPRR